MVGRKWMRVDVNQRQAKARTLLQHFNQKLSPETNTHQRVRLVFGRFGQHKEAAKQTQCFTNDRIARKSGSTHILSTCHETSSL